MTNPLAPRRVSRIKVLGAILAMGAMVGGIWYIYRLQQSRTIETQHKPIEELGTRPRMNGKPLGYQPAPPDVVKVDLPVTPLETNGHPKPDDSVWDAMMARMASLEHRLAQRAAPPQGPAPATTAPDPSIALRRKALAESRRAPLVVLSTGQTAKDATGDPARTLQRGWKIPFLVEHLVNSDIPGSWVARVSEVVYASSPPYAPLIPQGASILASADSGRLVPGNERLPSAAISLAIPGRKPLELGSMPMMDQEGQLGLVDDINHHRARLIGGIFLRGVMTGSTRVIQAEAREFGPAGEIGAGIAQGAQQGTNQQIQQLYDVRPTIKVYRGSRGYILITKDLTIPKEDR